MLFMNNLMNTYSKTFINLMLTQEFNSNQYLNLLIIAIAHRKGLNSFHPPIHKGQQVGVQ